MMLSASSPVRPLKDTPLRPCSGCFSPTGGDPAGGESLLRVSHLFERYTMTTFRSGIALTAALMLAALTGCGASNTASSSPSTSVSSSVSAASSSVASSQAWKDLVSATGVEITYDADGSRVLTDNGGQKVELPATVGRIANLWDANNQVMLLLGSSDRIVATTQQISKMPWYKKVQPKIAQASTPVSGTDLNVEELLKAKPDVVVSIDKTQVEKARAAGLTTVQLGFQDFAGLKKNVVMTAEVLGTDQARSQAIKYITYLEKNLKFVSERTASLSDDQRPKVLHIAGGSDVTKVDGSDSIIGEWMKAAGAKNSIDGVANYKNISLEQIIASAPDAIIVGNSDAQKGIDTIRSDAAWKDVPAVKNDKLYRNPVGTFKWDRYSTEEALQLLWAGKTLHPELFTDVDLVKETREFYSTFYGYQLTEDDAQRILAGQNPAS